MTRTWLPRFLAIAFAAGLAAHATVGAQGQREPDASSTNRIIVKWASASAREKAVFQNGNGARKATALTGVPLTHFQAVTDDLEVLQAAQSMDGTALDAVIRQLEADPAIEYASPDLRRQRHATTSDPLLPDQWYLLSQQPAATRTDAAWDLTQGSSQVVVAVLDTGARFDHPEITPVSMGGKLVPGYDFITDLRFANDGDGRDGDATDPGDWVDSTDRTQQVFKDCTVSSSSWHGTRVAGLIGAITDNGAGVAGAAWNTRILPVRVLGKCGGFDTDIIAGMRWAAGLSVSGVPANPTPAKVINMSLGGKGVCSAAYQAAVNEIIARGVLIVVSAGNEGGPVDTPANCTGVLGVAGIRHIGTKVGFSSLGPEIGIGAPGGNCVNTGPRDPCLFSIVVPSNSGLTVPEASIFTDSVSRPPNFSDPNVIPNYNLGTSFSAPLAAAAAALMVSSNAALTPAQSIMLIKASAGAFPTNNAVATCHVPVSANDIQNTECNCTTDTCGAGMLNTGAAVAATTRPFGVVAITGAVTSGGSISASASASFVPGGRSITKYEWTAINGSGVTATAAAPTQIDTAVQISGNGQFTLRLTITDNTGAQDVKDVVLSTPPPPVVTPPAQTPAPSGGGGGGGGGGEFGWGMVLASALLVARRVRRQTAKSRG